jgi:glucans biosynthesis protein
MKYFVVMSVLFISGVWAFTPVDAQTSGQGGKEPPKPGAERRPVIKLVRNTPETPSPIVTSQVLPTPSPTVAQPVASTPPVDFDEVVKKALDLSRQPFDESAQNSDPSLGALQYDDYRKIRFNRTANLLPPDGNFRVEIQPTGFLFKKYVLIHIFDGDVERPIGNVSSLFDTHELPPEIGQAVQASGFKVLFPLHNNGRRDETVVFQGASYFRPLAADQQFGASARGLAVDTASAKGEEFPYFREFWIRTSVKRPDRIRVFALMDSQSLTGAYSFIVSPGSKSVIDVEAHLFPRAGIEKVGVAPLTSMFVFGETPHPRFSDYRKEVHDSDGLLMWTGSNEWLWRPLQNPYPNGVRVTQYMDENPQGFGLMQRDVDYQNYLDLEARYDRRPSLWVSPKGQWGKGTVELVEISTAEETVDNIVAYWVPKEKLPVGKATVFRYSVSAVSRGERHHPLGKAVRMSIGHYHDPGMPLDQRGQDRIFSVDFTDGILSELSEDEVTGIVEARNGTVRDVRVQKEWMLGGMRLWFRLTPGEGDTDIRMSISRGRQQITESVLYLYLNDDE